MFENCEDALLDITDRRCCANNCSRLCLDKSDSGVRSKEVVTEWRVSFTAGTTSSLIILRRDGCRSRCMSRVITPGEVVGGIVAAEANWLAMNVATSAIVLAVQPTMNPLYQLFWLMVHQQRKPDDDVFYIWSNEPLLPLHRSYAFCVHSPDMKYFCNPPPYPSFGCGCIWWICRCCHVLISLIQYSFDRTNKKNDIFLYILHWRGNDGMKWQVIAKESRE